MKVLDAKSLRAGLKATKTSLQTLDDQVKDLEQRVQAVITLDEAFKGKGAQAIRSFYQELHMPFLLFLEGFIADYQEILTEMENALQSLEGAEDGYIHEQFLEHDLVDGLKKAERVTTALTDEVNASIKTVRDIISLPTLDDEEFLFNLTQGRTQIYDTLEKLHDYDTRQSAKLEDVETDLQVMKNYLEQIGSKFASGELGIKNYSVKQLEGNNAYDWLLKSVQSKVRGNTFSFDNILMYGAKEFLTRFTKLPIPGAAVTYIQKKLEMRTVDYSARAMKVLMDIKSDSITAQEFATIQANITDIEQVSDYKGEFQGKYLAFADGRIVRKFKDGDGNVKYEFVRDIPENREKPEEVNPFVKAGQSILEIGEDIKHGFEERADKRHDSWYDYANYWTSGLLDIGKGFGEGLESRGEEVLESPSFYSVTNWISIGGLDLVNGAVNPDEALSKEHLMASFGLASLFSIAKAPVTSGGSSAVKAAGKAADAEKKVKPVEGKEKASSRSSVKGAASKLKDDMFKPILIPSVSNLFNWIRKNVPEVGLVREAGTGQYYFFARENNGGGSFRDRNKSTDSNNFNFSDLTHEEKLKITKEYAIRSPIEIPSAAKVKVRSKTSYEQITYKWNDGDYKYEVRWHTRTPGAPESQGNTWVIQRTIPGNGGSMPQTFFMVGKNEWIEAHKWYDAIAARKAGVATNEQLKLLNDGHWKD
ncbi:ribonuclease YeeF family protein [Lentibacillus populi]|uniref:ribonuclease YeeF family protein n=1 Tax=Lentibacillus populi TaxID=1827502 RepID=UPI0022A97A62|nr:LXG domain-containing protein [Lentibacillus populi]